MCQTQIFQTLAEANMEEIENYLLGGEVFAALNSDEYSQCVQRHHARAGT